MVEFVPFRFHVNMYADDKNKLLCSGAFSEVTGLEMTMEPRVIPEGGRNWGEIQRSGQTKFSPIILKRGVTTMNDMWDWIDVTSRGANYGYRLNGEILVFGMITKKPKEGEESKQDPMLTWKVINALPTYFKGPDLSSTGNQVAIEELHLVHEGLELERLKQ